MYSIWQIGNTLYKWSWPNISYVKCGDTSDLHHRKRTWKINVLYLITAANEHIFCKHVQLSANALLLWLEHSKIEPSLQMIPEYWCDFKRKHSLFSSCDLIKHHPSYCVCILCVVWVFAFWRVAWLPKNIGTRVAQERGKNSISAKLLSALDMYLF